MLNPVPFLVAGAGLAGIGLLDPNPKRGTGLMLLGGALATVGLAQGFKLLPSLREVEESLGVRRELGESALKGTKNVGARTSEVFEEFGGLPKPKRSDPFPASFGDTSAAAARLPKFTPPTFPLGLPRGSGAFARIFGG